jgi:uncharacterized repeat protein (TIGR03806 family)
VHRILGLSTFLWACGAPAGPWVPSTGRPPEWLSTLGLMAYDDGQVTYPEGVVPYTLNTPLFSDYTEKERAFFLPEGEAMAFSTDRVFDLPVGAAVLKTFLLPRDLRDPEAGRDVIETRLMIHTARGWQNWPYVWNDDRSDARLRVQGGVQNLSFIDQDGASVTFPYLVPQRNQCQECHELKDDDDRTYITLIGPRSRNLDLEQPTGGGQLEHLASLGLLEGLTSERPRPAIDWATFMQDGLDRPYEEIDVAARDYLDVNCGHCHNPRGVNGITSQLFLNWDSTDEFRLGKCKRPGSAAQGTGGLTYDIVPGDHTQSILHYRMVTDDPGAMMPQLGRSLVHHEAVALIAAWIDGMEPEDCD